MEILKTWIFNTTNLSLDKLAIKLVTRYFLGQKFEIVKEEKRINVLKVFFFYRKLAWLENIFASFLP